MTDKICTRNKSRKSSLGRKKKNTKYVPGTVSRSFGLSRYLFQAKQEKCKAKKNKKF